MKTQLSLGAVVALAVACSSSSTPTTGTPAPQDTGTATSTAGGGCEKNPQGICYPTDDLGTSPRIGANFGQRIRNFKFLGYKNADPTKPTDASSGTPTLIQLADYYDPSGQTFKLIHLAAASFWCIYCNQESEELASGGAAKWAAQGVIFIEALIDGHQVGVPATPTDLQHWISGPRIDETNTTYKTPLNFTVFLDPAVKNLGSFFPEGGVPFNMNIDPRSMEILDTSNGYAGSADAEVGSWPTDLPGSKAKPAPQ